MDVTFASVALPFAAREVGALSFLFRAAQGSYFDEYVVSCGTESFGRIAVQHRLSYRIGPDTGLVSPRKGYQSVQPTDVLGCQ